MDSGVAKKPITDWAAYNRELQRIGIDQKPITTVIDRAKRVTQASCLAEGDNPKSSRRHKVLVDEELRSSSRLAIVPRSNDSLKGISLN